MNLYVYIIDKFNYKLCSGVGCLSCPKGQVLVPLTIPNIPVLPQVPWQHRYLQEVFIEPLLYTRSQGSTEDQEFWQQRQGGSRRWRQAVERQGMEAQ